METNKIMKISILESGVNKNFEVGEEIAIEYNNKIYHGKIINTMHDAMLLRFYIFIHVYDENESEDNKHYDIQKLLNDARVLHFVTKEEKNE